MAETTITGLPNATTPLAGTERVPMDQAGATKDGTTQDIANLATKATVGLGNVDNTSDANKPISTATATALAGKEPSGAAAAAVAAHVAAADPHTQYATTAEAATDLAYDATTRLLSSSTGADVVLPVATTTTAGLESAADKTKLDSITVDSATLVRKFVRNNSGASIPKGSAVYQAGSSGTTLTVALADASAEATASPTLGLTQETIANNANGYVVAVGLLDGISTATLTEGQIVWLSETAGGLTTTRPTQPAHGVVCGYCVKQGSGTSGILYVKVDNGLELNELHDVLIASPTAGQVLRRDSNGLWKNAVLAAADISGLGTAATTPATDYAPAAQGVTGGNSHNHDGGDGAQIAYSSLSGLPTLPTGTNTGDQTLANTSNATSHTVTLSGSGGSLQLVEGSNITLTTSGTGSAGVVTIASAGGGGGGGSGTVTSVGLVAPTGFSVSGSPVTTSGDITLAFAAGYSLPTTASQTSWDTAFTERRYWDGGATGLTASTGRTSLGLGGAAVLNVGTSAGTVAAGDDSRLATDLTFDASTRLLSSSTGADVTLPLVTSATAGLAPLSGGGTSNFLRADGTWAAPAGGGGSAPAPGYQTFANGSLIAPINCPGPLSALNAALQRIVYHPIYIPVSQTFTQILARTNTTYAGTTDIYLGVYSHDSTVNRPLTKVYDSGLLQITASGQANYGPGIISLTLSAGFYWLAFLASAISATPSFMGTPNNARGVGSPWFSEFKTDGTIVPYVLQSGQLTLPSTAAATTPGSSPSQPVVFLGV